MVGSYVLSFQVYLGLPLQANMMIGSEPGTSAAVFFVSGLATILGQMRVTAWCRRRWGPGRSIVLGLATMGSAFFPMLAANTLPSGPNGTTRLAIGVIALVVTSALLGIGTAIVFPFEMDTILSRNWSDLGWRA